MPTITTALRRHGIVALAALTAIVIQAAPSAAQVALRYERSAVAAGEWWRLASSHLVHAGWTHLGLNLAALVLLSLLLRPRAVRQQVLLWSITAAGTGLALLGLMPELDWYVGLSGVLHGVAAWWVLDLLRAAPVAGALALLGIAGKLAMDFASGGQGSAALIGVPVIVEAHLYGAVAGALAWLATATPLPPARKGPSATRRRPALSDHEGGEAQSTVSAGAGRTGFASTLAAGSRAAGPAS